MMSTIIEGTKLTEAYVEASEQVVKLAQNHVS